MLDEDGFDIDSFGIVYGCKFVVIEDGKFELFIIGGLVRGVIFCWLFRNGDVVVSYFFIVDFYLYNL